MNTNKITENKNEQKIRKALPKMKTLTVEQSLQQAGGAAANPASGSHTFLIFCR